MSWTIAFAAIGAAASAAGAMSQANYQKAQASMATQQANEQAAVSELNTLSQSNERRRQYELMKSELTNSDPWNINQGSRLKQLKNEEDLMQKDLDTISLNNALSQMDASRTRAGASAMKRAANMNLATSLVKTGATFGNTLYEEGVFDTSDNFVDWYE